MSIDDIRQSTNLRVVFENDFLFFFFCCSKWVTYGQIDYYRVILRSINDNLSFVIIPLVLPSAIVALLYDNIQNGRHKPVIYSRQIAI